MSETPEPGPNSLATTEQPLDRLRLVRDAVVFQVKLAIDGIVDFLLLPVALVSALISFFTGSRTFYDAVRFGAQMDRRINLFGAARGELDVHAEPEEDRIDELAMRIETEVRKEYEQGTLKSSARAAIDQAVKAIRKASMETKW